MIEKFEPWVGDQYGSPTNLFGGIRVLIVGESHHSTSDQIGSCKPDLTQIVMGIYAKGKRGGWCRTIDNVAWAASGKSPQELARTGWRGEMDVWGSMAFYNYIPIILAKAARRERPSPEIWAKGREPFVEVLRQLAPDVIVICGFEMFPWVVRNNFPEYVGDPWAYKGARVELHDGRTQVIRMVHPSTGFSHRKWHPIIADAIREVANARKSVPNRQMQSS